MVRDGRAALGDFGIAMSAAVAPQHAAAGTELFLAPELGAGAAPSARSDVYSAAITIRSLFTHPSPRMEAVLTRAASHRPEDRPRDGAALLASLRAAAEPRKAVAGVRDPSAGSDDPTGPAEPAGPVERVGPAGTGPPGLPVGRASRRGGRRRPIVVAAVACGVVVLAGGAVWVRHSPQSGLARGSPGAAHQTAPELPGATPAPVAVQPGDGTATVAWERARAGADGVVTVTPEDPALAVATCVSAAPATGCTVDGLTNGATYSVTVAFRTAGRTGPASSPVTTVPYPALLSGSSLALWLDAADGATLLKSSLCEGEAVSAGAPGPAVTADATARSGIDGPEVGCWTDKSPRHNDASQTAIDARPRSVSVAGRRQLAFVSRQSMSLARPADLPVGGAPSTVFVTALVGRPVAPGPRVALYWGAADGRGAGRTVAKAEGNRRASVGVDVAGTSPGSWGREPTVVVGRYDASTVRARLDGSDADVLEADLDTGSDVAYVGRDWGGHGWLGDIGEVIVFDRILTDAEVNTVEDYLYRKWGVGVR